jgi:hypothetical protein
MEDTMAYNKYLYWLIVSILIALFTTSLYADDSKTENKDITIISAQSSSDGKSEVRKELLEECIFSLPNANTLEAVVTSDSKYLHNVNGDLNKNGYYKVYSATVEVNYLLYQKELIIITTSSIKGQKPVMKEVDKKVRQRKDFASDANNGDLFAGKGTRQYYFSTEQKAVEDVMKRVKTWLQQQKNTLCTM